jgi:hypothetical protein
MGYYSVFDGAISQINVVNNFIFSSTTGNPFTWNVYNTADVEFNAYLELSQYYLDWGDGSPVIPVTAYTPNSLVHIYNSNPSGYTITLSQNSPWGNTKVSKNIKTPTVIKFRPFEHSIDPEEKELGVDPNLEIFDFSKPNFMFFIFRIVTPQYCIYWFFTIIS